MRPDDPSSSPAVALWVILTVILVQRIAELLHSAHNAKVLRAMGAAESGAGHYPLLVAVHVGFLVMLPLEVLVAGTGPDSFWPLWLGLWVGAQLLRYCAVRALGVRWNVRIWTLPGALPIRSGPYRFLRHPNYVAVIVELMAAPLLFGAWRTAIVVAVLNAIALAIRIPAEEHAMAAVASSAAPQVSQTRIGTAP